MKPGILTTEFWLVLVVQVANAGAVVGGIVAPQYGVMIGAGLAAVYTIARTVAKAANVPDPTPADPVPVPTPPIGTPATMRSSSLTKIFAFAFALLLLSIPGCSQQGATTQPNLGTTVGGEVFIIAARVGMAQISAKVEAGYAAGKLTPAEYTLARSEEQAALNALDGLQAKLDSGTPVTQADINAATITFITPLNGLIAQYALTTLPPAQPTKSPAPAPPTAPSANLRPWARPAIG